jgi:hypothetical protein
MTRLLKIFLIAIAGIVSGCGGSDSCGSKIAFGSLISINCGEGDVSSQVNGNDVTAELLQKIKNGVSSINAFIVINGSNN